MHHPKTNRPHLVLVKTDSEIDHDAILLRALSRTVGPDHFDEISISANGHRYPELREALRCLNVRWDRAHYLRSPSLHRVRRWLDAIAERDDVGGLRLIQTARGWCDIVEVSCDGPTEAAVPRRGDIPETAEQPATGPRDAPRFYGFDR